jgi:FAD:protein FMN transferase
MRLLYIFLLIICCSSFKLKQPYKAFQIDGYAQGTTYHITYYAKDSLLPKQQVDSIFIQLDSSLSIYKSYSLISRFNNSVSGAIMDKHLHKVIAKSLAVSKDTRGLFDITVQPLVQVWGFGIKEETEMPDSSKIASILNCVGSNKILIKKDILTKIKPCITVDVNGIAQGYSVDVLALYLESKDIQNYLVELGGEVRVQGMKLPNNLPFIIGIEAAGNDPLTGTAIQKKIVIKSGAVTTSGINRKMYESGSKKVSHLINPMTGYPIENELISVTVWAKDAITADAYDNALMCMGLKQALQFVALRQQKLQAYFIYKSPDGNIRDTATQKFYKFMAH